MAKSTRKRSRRKGLAAPASGLDAINHFVVVMLENRSFDHMLGYTKALNPAIAGTEPTDFNYVDPITKTDPVQVSRATTSAIGFDPGHEFDQVDDQIHGPEGGRIPMGGFIQSSGGSRARQVMECFEPDQLPAFTKLAGEFAIFNFWYSSMPGPTWPNRFFVHASTSGGLFESPDTGSILLGFRFKNGTLYDQLQAAGKSWRVYHEDKPQVLGIRGMVSKYLRGPHFRQMQNFYRDVRSGELPDYAFIEPNHDPHRKFINGNSMHPENDVRHGERLIKDVYEAIRNSKYWTNTMLVVTFDEHGGFYDHLVPPAAPPTGDDSRYGSRDKTFAFDRYGVRVPTIVVSAYTDRQTVIGKDPDDPIAIFDHSSIPATVQKRFRLKPLSKRDAKANTLDAALTRTSARDADAPKKLPSVTAPKPIGVRARGLRRVAPSAAEPLSKDQEAFLALSIALDREMSPAKRRMSATAARAMIRTPAQAAAYAARVQARALARRRASPGSTERRTTKRTVRRNKRQ